MSSTVKTISNKQLPPSNLESDDAKFWAISVVVVVQACVLLVVRFNFFGISAISAVRTCTAIVLHQILISPIPIIRQPKHYLNTFEKASQLYHNNCNNGRKASGSRRQGSQALQDQVLTVSYMYVAKSMRRSLTSAIAIRRCISRSTECATTSVLTLRLPAVCPIPNSIHGNFFLRTCDTCRQRGWGHKARTKPMGLVRTQVRNGRGIRLHSGKQELRYYMER